MLLSVPAIVRSGLRGGLIPTQAGLLSFSRSTTRRELPASKVVVSGLACGSPLALATHSTLDTLHYSRPWKPVSKIKWKSKFWGENMACAATRTRPPENKKGHLVDTCARHQAASVFPWPSPDGPRSRSNPNPDSLPRGGGRANGPRGHQGASESGCRSRHASSRGAQWFPGFEFKTVKQKKGEGRTGGSSTT